MTTARSVRTQLNRIVSVGAEHASCDIYKVHRLYAIHSLWTQVVTDSEAVVPPV